jgi:hypothetical protein
MVKQIVSNEYINIKIVSEKIREWKLLQLEYMNY